MNCVQSKGQYRVRLRGRTDAEGEGTGEDEGEFIFLIMEFLNGKALSDEREQERYMQVPHKPENLRNTAEAAYELGFGLFTLHSIGLCHMDIKPANLVVHIYKDEDGAERYAYSWVDFGLSCEKGTAGDPGKGTKKFMAPEYKTPRRPTSAAAAGGGGGAGGAGGRESGTGDPHQVIYDLPGDVWSFGTLLQAMYFKNTEDRNFPSLNFPSLTKEDLVRHIEALDAKPSLSTASSFVLSQKEVEAKAKVLAAHADFTEKSEKFERLKKDAELVSPEYEQDYQDAKGNEKQAEKEAKVAKGVWNHSQCVLADLRLLPMEDLLADLIMQMKKKEPSERIRMQDALKHDFFRLSLIDADKRDANVDHIIGWHEFLKVKYVVV